MNKIGTGLAGLGTLLALLAAATPLRAQDAVYREVFPNNTGSALAVGTSSWQVNQTPTGNAVDVSTAGSIFISPLNGRPAGFKPANSNPISAELAHGFYVDSSAGGTGYNVLMWTSEYGIPINAYLHSQVEWWQGNDTATDADRVAVRVNQNWYVSNRSFQQAAGLGGDINFATDSGRKILDVSTAQWRVLNFNQGTQLAITGGLVSLPTNIGDVTAFGLYVDNKTSSLRFDSYSVTTPEPGMATLFSIGTLVLGSSVFRKRRRVSRR